MKRLLVVDDEQIIRDVFQDIVGMNCSDVAVETASSGEEALTKLQKKKYDLVFLDMKMKKPDGLETFRRMQKINPKQQVFIVTGYFDEEKNQQALSEGVCGTIYKPFTVTQIMEVIEKYVRSRHAVHKS